MDLQIISIEDKWNQKELMCILYVMILTTFEQS